MSLVFIRKSWDISICRLAENPADHWYAQGHFWSVTRTPNEVSILCETALVPPGIKAEHGWACYMVEGPIDFAVTGVLAGLAAVMAENGISIFAVSTYDTDYILLKREYSGRAEHAWQAAGYRIA